MAVHAHDADQASLLLTGSLKEETGSRAADLCAGCTGFKAAGLSHADIYGRDGALILSFNRPHDDKRMRPWLWRRTRIQGMVRLAALALEDESVCADALDDCAALLDGEDAGDRSGASPPAWLKRAREAVEADPADARADALAADAGVHRVHFCRRFAAAFGQPFSLYRRRVMVAKAVRALAEDGAASSAAALEAGFADQAHFVRALKAQTGVTPSRLSALLDAA